MMENKKSGFRFDMNDDDPNSYIRTRIDPVQKRIEARRMDKINRRITWISFLIPCLVCVIILAAYLDFKQRFNNTNTTTEVKNLTKEWEAKLSILTKQYKNLEESLNVKENPYNEVFLAYEKTIGTLEKSLKNVQTRIDTINMSKADKTEIETSIKALKDEIQKLSENMAKINEAASAQINKQISEQMKIISSDVQTSIDDLKNLKEKMSLDLEQSLAKINESSSVSKHDIDLLSKEIKQVKKDVVDVLADTIDRKTLNAALRKQERVNKKKVDFIIKTLGDKENSIRALKRSVQNLEKRIKSLSRKKMGTPEPGKVLEQDL